MKAYSIVIQGAKTSETGFAKLCQSSVDVGNDFEVQRFDAVVPKQVSSKMKELDVKWNYPWRGFETDFATGLTKTAYKTKNPEARIACALSHYELWLKCISLDEPILILEHDAVFINKIDFDPKDTTAFILGINNPLGATRKSADFYNTIIGDKRSYQPSPSIDHFDVPQGLAGNSAYMIKPAGAQAMIDLVAQHGLWPNDAIMCRQLIPRLMVTKKFYTTIQGLKSTTT